MFFMYTLLRLDSQSITYDMYILICRAVYLKMTIFWATLLAQPSKIEK